MTNTEEKTYTFAELSAKAKQHARDSYTADGYLDHDWWDNVHEDAERVAKILGIEFSARVRKLENCRELRKPYICFFGFYSQCDGACFEGNYTYNPKAVNEIKAYCNDEELIRIATELNALQLMRLLQGLSLFTAFITTRRSNYSHSNTMDVDVNCEGDEHIEVGDDLEETVQQLMRDFADWIYNSLEAEHDWLHSDECVDAALVDEKFDEDGSVI